MSNRIKGKPVAAASARLCVETVVFFKGFLCVFAAASARLCVETEKMNNVGFDLWAAASARLCVETFAL